MKTTSSDLQRTAEEEIRNTQRLRAWEARFQAATGRPPALMPDPLRTVAFQQIVKRRKHLHLIRHARETASNILFLKKRQDITFGHFPGPEAS